MNPSFVRRRRVVSRIPAVRQRRRVRSSLFGRMAERTFRDFLCSNAHADINCWNRHCFITPCGLVTYLWPSSNEIGVNTFLDMAIFSQFPPSYNLTIRAVNRMDETRVVRYFVLGVASSKMLLTIYNDPLSIGQRPQYYHRSPFSSDLVGLYCHNYTEPENNGDEDVVSSKLVVSHLI